MQESAEDIHDDRLSFDSLFSASLTLMTMLIAVFTLAIERALYLKGEPNVYPWYFLCIVSGLSTLCSSLLAYCCYKRKWESLIRKIFLSILILCGTFIPLFGLVLFFYG